LEEWLPVLHPQLAGDGLGQQRVAQDGENAGFALVRKDLAVERPDPDDRRRLRWNRRHNNANRPEVCLADFQECRAVGVAGDLVVRRFCPSSRNRFDRPFRGFVAMKS
jgi:hypothetical protein